MSESENVQESKHLGGAHADTFGSDLVSENEESVQELKRLMESKEGAGIQELMDLCRSIEEAYFSAIDGTTEYNIIYASDSTS